MSAYGKEPPLDPPEAYERHEIEDAKSERIHELEQVITDTKDFLETVLENAWDKSVDGLVDKIQNAVDMLEL